MVIKTVIRWPNNMVMVFDHNGEQLPEYQGQYEVVKEGILRDAPADAAFAHSVSAAGALRKVPREAW